jgi:hypothetical protein
VPSPLARSVLALLAGAGPVLAQAGEVVDPFTLIARAERAFTDAAADEGIVLLWSVIDQLAASPERAATAAGVAAVNALLRTHDPLDAERRAVLSACARAQLGLALLYRGKKWGRSALDCLDLADRFEPGASRKEREQLVAARLVNGEPSVLEPRGYSLLQRHEAVRAEGPWREVGDTLECGAHPAQTPWYEWTIDARHEDCELAVEFRSSDPKAPHDCALLVGLDRDDWYYQCIAAYYAEDGRYDVGLFERKGTAAATIASASVAPLPGPDGFHRLTLRVHGKALRVQLDDAPALEANAKIAPRGRFGITVGLENQASVPITLRSFERRPWPPLSAAERHAIVQDGVRERIVEGIDGAGALLGRKEPDAAAQRLRIAWRDTTSLDRGPLRASLAKAIDELAPKADLLHSRRQKVGHEGVRALTALADRYAAGGQVRAACRLVELAAALDPVASEARLAQARQAVASAPKPAPQPR